MNLLNISMNFKKGIEQLGNAKVSSDSESV